MAVAAAEARTQGYKELIEKQIPVSESSITFSGDASVKKIVGKVRDIYVGQDQVVLVATDRLSGFDRQLATVPCKGHVLNSVSAWWFEQTKDIVPNHIVKKLDPMAIACKKCTVFPVEFIARGYMTGSTNTSLWTHYSKGCRDYCGNIIPDGLQKDCKLPKNIITPTTKDDVHDELISGKEIVSSGRMTQEEWDYCSTKALELFNFGQEIAKSRGLILVDTKYEFGKDADGSIMLIDEIHTPDSSRYWIEGTYEERFAKGEKPDHIDKEFLRLWFRERCDPYKDQVIPEAPRDLLIELSRRYILLYELITGERFEFADANESTHDRLASNLKSAFVTDA